MRSGCQCSFENGVSYVRQEPSVGAGRILREVVETEGRDSRVGQGLM